MNVLVWHVHGSWTTAFVQGRHSYLLPLLPGRPGDGGGRSTSWSWPSAARDVPVEQLADAEVDVVLVQRPHELELAERWLRRRPGHDVPLVYLEHNTPKGDVPGTRHPVADRDDVLLVHVTHFNSLFWDSGSTRTTVVEHGIVDPGQRWTGELARAAVAVNEPVRRGRVTGTDLLAGFADVAPLDVFGMGLEGLHAAAGVAPGRVALHPDLRQDALHEQMARRRAYVHPLRWTSLGLSLLEAMHLGMPVVVLGTTEAHEAVPPEAGVVSTRLDVLHRALRTFVADPDAARAAGRSARAAALDRYGLDRFLADWDTVLSEVVR